MALAVKMARTGLRTMLAHASLQVIIMYLFPLLPAAGTLWLRRGRPSGFLVCAGQVHSCHVLSNFYFTAEAAITHDEDAIGPDGDSWLVRD